MSEICGEVPKDNIRQWIRDNEKDIKEKYISWYKEQWKLAHNQAEGVPIELQESTEEVLTALKKELPHQDNLTAIVIRYAPKAGKEGSV